MKRLAVVLVATLFMILMAGPVAIASGKTTPSHKVEIPAGATTEQVREIMGGLTDEQVRELLIGELQKEAVARPVAPSQEKGLVGLIKRLKQGAGFVRDRFEYLFSGASAAPREVPKALKSVLAGSGELSAGELAVALGVLTLLWFGSIRLFKRKTTPARKAIAATPEDSPWYTRMGRLFLRALLDLSGVVIITVIAFVCYLVFFSEEASAKPVVIAWLAAMLFMELVKVVARFLLAPHAPTLRYLPLSDEAAQYIFRWGLNVARVMAAGLLVSGLIRLEGGSEAVFLLTATVFGFIVAAMLTLLALWNKRRVAEAIKAMLKPDSLLYQFADSWHLGAITYVMGSWMFWVFALMIFGSEALLSGVLTLVLVPAYFLFDWATQRLVGFAVDMAGPRGEERDEAAENGTPGPVIHRFQDFLRKGFRVLIFAAAVFLLLRIWGMDIAVGRATVRAGINMLITLVVAYIFWVSMCELIDRKLREKEQDEESGESGEGGGGPGGDRFSTLLQLVKRFIFVAITVITVLIILSSMGVDIGPLLAGASVFGIAIGFGAQTLVKDVISGIFFLMDDAFRVGDYIEVGSAMGTVEEISVRSFKLRHHLGMLYTIPFGSVKEIKNMSRDWSVMKLQYLVPYDTDLQQIKKIIKEINKEVRAVPELNEMMLSDIKSQGVKALEEYGMRMRVKFMTKPGGQFTLRKLVLAKMRKKFEEAGIEFAKPRVSVHIPTDKELSPEQEAQAAVAASQVVGNEPPRK